MSAQRPVVAIDGPAGTGKSTVARELASRLGLPYLDTGAMYRVLGLLALERRIDPDDPTAATALAAEADLALHVGPGHVTQVLLDGREVGERIRTSEVGEVTSRLAVHAGVRARMIELQRDLARRFGGVLEGRDIGTRVLPETPFKFFLDAAPAVRAQRRRDELRARGLDVGDVDVEREIAERDARDMARTESPLRPAADAWLVDTTELSVDEVVQRLTERIRERRASAAQQELETGRGAQRKRP